MNVFMIGMLVIGLFQNPSLLWAREINQETFSFINETVRYPAKATFVVTNAIHGNRLVCDQATSIALASCQLPVVHFQIGSAELGRKESDRLQAELRRYAIPPERGLIITGHACGIGQASRNLDLSRQRARSVAVWLRAHGYTLAEVQGVGARYPVAGVDHLELNRRVELAVSQP